MGRKIKIGMGQMLVEGGLRNANLSRAVEMITRAGAAGCDFIVLPECLDLGWTFPDTRSLAESIPGKTSDVLSKAALKNHIHVVAGLAEKDGQEIFNSAVMISSGGELLARHRKINVLDIARGIYSVGGTLSVTNTVFGKIGMDICADNFPSAYAIGHALARMGADIILSPASWAVAPDDRNPNPCEMWERSYSSLAELFDIPVVGVSNIGSINSGVWKDYRCIGNSLAFFAGGELADRGDYTWSEESLIVTELEIHSGRPLGTDISPKLRRRGFSLPED